jgi:hypothetical protein
MSTIMAVLLNGVAQLEFDRSKPLPDHQAAYLEKMDEKLDEGVMVGDELILEPDIAQRAQFVSANLAHAIKSDNEEMTAALCTYLAVRIPELKQVKLEDTSGELSIELVFDEDYQKQVAVEFTQLH